MGARTFFFQAEDGIRDYKVTGVQTCALPICEDVDERGLARPVRPDDRDELTGADAEAHAVERAELAVELPEPLGAEDHGDEASTGGRLTQNPASPPGATMTIAARIAPKISRQNGTTDITQS